MNKQEKLDKILEMTKEITLLRFDWITEEELDEMYIQTSFMLEKLKELKGSDK